MTEAIQLKDTAIDFEAGAPAILKIRWVVAPEDTTSINLDKVVKHKSESGASKQSNSLTSLLLTDSDMREQIFREVLVYDQVRVENTPLTFSVGSTDSFTPTQDYYSKHVFARLVKDEVERLFSLATFIDLEPGMTNDFSDGLAELIEKHGEFALREIQELAFGEAVPFTIVAEALRYLGNIESANYAEERRKLLEVCLLKSKYMLVRDGAAVGLSYIEDKKSIPCLLRAIEQESHSELKNDLIEVLSLLQDTSAE